MNSLTITSKRDGKALRLTLSGQIDEAADYSPVQPGDAKTVIFDFEGIKLINSTGLQRWIKFLAGLPKDVETVFARCSIRVVTQINMFPGFVAGRKVKIESFFAPYFCEACDGACDILVDATQHGSALTSFKAPKMKCPKCAGDAEFDGIEKKYFLFLQAS
jgi:hypothetical protein